MARINEPMHYPGTPEITPIEIRMDEIEKFNKEWDFTKLSFDLLREATQYSAIAACAVPASCGGWDKDHAVLCGLMIRISKLLHGVLGYGAEDRREIVMILARCAFETIVNVRYLLRNFNSETLYSFRKYSLRHEKQLRDEIISNIEDQNGQVLNIEGRMLASIDSAFQAAGISPDDINPNDRKGWGGKSIYGRAKDVGMERHYLALFGGSSHAVHGNWQDLMDHHLEEKGGIYYPKVDFNRSRPQYFQALSIVVIETIRDYFDFIDPLWPQELRDRLDVLNENIVILSQAHEEYLRKKHPDYDSYLENS